MLHPLNYQLPPNELADYYSLILPVIKKNRLKSIGIYLFFIIYFSIPSFQIPILEYNGFRITALMEQRAIENYLLFYPHQSWVSIDNVNPVLLKAIISMEDGAFFNHHGIDWKEFYNSLRANDRRGKTVRGGSTITMQLAKNLYLNTERSIFRKAKELVIAARMEKELSKKNILEAYINAIEWGDGIFGIDAASAEYFDKDPADLTLMECSKIAAVIPSPLIHQPNVNSGYVRRRAGIIRGRLNDVILYPEIKDEQKRSKRIN
jgi:monofunctional biosynthetic peptidoglycan transglycosylase